MYEIFERHCLETTGLRFNIINANYIMQKFIETGQYVALEDFVLLSKNAFGCDRDYLFQRLVEAHSLNPYKMYDIWEYIQEEGHIPSQKLLSEMTKILDQSGLNVPSDMKEGELTKH